MSKYGNSSFWLGDWADDDIISNSLSDQERKSYDLYKLASSKRAISNFVSIVTNENIPVTFRGQGDSYTDGEKVVIGANIIKPKDFDVCVGLALHEGSHIKLSDFDILKKLDVLIPDDVYNDAESKGLPKSETRVNIKNLWNYVEDRRIDNFIYSTAPGYREYYLAMYDKYFNDRVITKALQTKEYTDESIESYMFRIVNLTNENTRLDALNGLRDIYSTIDFKNIDRLKSSADAFKVALEMFKIILSNLPEPTGSSEDESDQSQEGDGQEGQGGQGSSSKQMSGEDMDDSMSGGGSPSNDSEMDMDGNENQESSEGGSSSETDSDGDGTPDSSNGSQSGQESDEDSDEPEVELTERQKKLLPNKIEKQKDFLNGERAQKSMVSKADQTALQNIEESGSELITVGDNVEDGTWNRNRGGVECVVVKKMTRSLMESSLFPLARKSWNSDDLLPQCEDAVDEGIRIGTQLGKKLQVRGEERNTIYNRQKTGRIDKRMIASLGYGNEHVFQYRETDSFKNANLHVSIDASSSMGGNKWTQTMTNVVALCKAVDMIENLDIQVSFRATSNDSTSKPYVVKAYDSREDKFSKVRLLFPYLQYNGTTPEGLCFEAIMDEFMPVSNEWDSYFLNISDGEPWFNTQGYSYSGSPAHKHTRNMVKEIQKMGIKVLSYYVEGMYGSDDSEPSRAFREMYGKAAKKIDVTNVGQISRTMNKLFLEK